MRRPPPTPYWIGDTVYLKHTQTVGTIIATTFVGDPANPVARFTIQWSDDEMSCREHYAIELSAEKNFST